MIRPRSHGDLTPLSVKPTRFTSRCCESHENVCNSKQIPTVLLRNCTLSAMDYFISDLGQDLRRHEDKSLIVESKVRGHIQPAVHTQVHLFKASNQPSSWLRDAFTTRMGRKRGFKRLLMWPGCLCRTGWAEYFRTRRSTGICTHNHLQGLQGTVPKRGNIQWAAVVWAVLKAEELLSIKWPVSVFMDHPAF